MYDEFVHIEVLFVTGGGRRSAIMGTESTEKIIKRMFKEREEENCTTDLQLRLLRRRENSKKSIALLYNHIPPSNNRLLLD